MTQSRWDNLFFALALVFIVLVVFMGGASQFAPQSNLVIRLVSIPVLMWSLYRLVNTKFDRRTLFVFVLVVLVGLLIAAQLWIVPIELWRTLPGRGQWANDLVELGLAPKGLPISLNPDGTTEALFGFLPIAAGMLVALTLTARQRFWVLVAFLSLGLISLMLGAVQYTSNPPTIFDFHIIGNTPADSSGYFANRNHWALYLSGLIPLAGAVLTDKSWKHSLPIFLAFGACLFLVVAGIAVSASRAGLVLMLVALLFTGLIWIGARQKKASALISSAIGAVCVSVIVGYVYFAGGLRALERFAYTGEGDSRQTIWEVTERAAWKLFPIGSGGGSFVTVFKTEEQVSELMAGYANQAHNEYLQILMEYGLFGLIVLGIAVIGLVVSTATWGRGSKYDKLNQQIVRDTRISNLFLLVFLFLCAFHSSVDYPLRTPTLGLMFAFIFAIVATPQVSLVKSVRK